MYGSQNSFWVEIIMGLNGKLTQLKCQVYNVMENKGKLLVFKFDMFQKYVGRHKTTNAHPKVDIGQYYVSKNEKIAC
jgi:hypothetical protein